MAKTLLNIRLEATGSTTAPTGVNAHYTVFNSSGPTVLNKSLSVAASMNKTLYNTGGAAELWATVITEINAAEGIV
jgi:hypothetical protein